MNIGDNNQTSVTHMSCTYYSVSKLKYRNSNSFSSFTDINFKQWKSEPWTYSSG